MRKQIFSVVLALALVLCLSPAVLAEAQTMVHDNAGLLTDDEVEQLEAQAQKLRSDLEMDFGIVTADSLSDKSAQDFADDFFWDNGFGTGPDRDGILLLYKPGPSGQREIHIATHGEAIRLFSDREIDDLLDLVIPLLIDEDYASAFSRFLRDGGSHIVSMRQAIDSGGGTAPEYTPGSSPLQGGSTQSNQDLPLRQQYSVGMILLSSLLMGAMVGAVVVGIMILVHKGSAKSAPGAGAYLDGGLNLTRRQDIFVHTHTSRTALPKDTGGSSGGGGSSRGSTSTHRSSSGSSFGGGGRKF